jgi:hypothetical protein
VKKPKNKLKSLVLKKAVQDTIYKLDHYEKKLIITKKKIKEKK